MPSELVTTHHLRRRAVVYVRQSTPHQVISNQESLRLQYALQQRARELGWHEADIDVIDADLGLSAAAAAHRPGFNDLVARVALGEVGLILSIEVTRLARNCSDWYPLLDVCGHRGCLIADRDGVYDPGTPNGRLLLGLKGTISELELHTLRGRLTAGLLAKAKRGELALALPSGLVRDPSGGVTKDPHREVQERITLVFDSFLQLRTAVKVTRTLLACGLMLPRRDCFGEICWKRPTIPAVTDILKNPAYAGAFVYGRTAIRPARAPGGRPCKAPQPASSWRIVVKDRYPAYISFEVFEKVQAMLRDNRAEYVRLRSRGVPRDGAALLHGITWCGECGHKMVVRYKGGSQYVCNHLHQQHDAPVCQCLRAAPIDTAVAAAFLEAVAPAEVEAWSRARKAQIQAEGALRRAEEQQVERLRYEAALAERQFNRVDPDNRLVAAELEQRWEAALVALRRAEESLGKRPAIATPSNDGQRRLDRRLQAKVLALGERLPEIWADPATRREHRKALLRCLIDKVVMHRSARDRAAVRIVWRGGATTDLTVMMPVNALHALPRYAEMEERILTLARIGLYDDEIARTLTDEGHRSPGRGTEVLPSTVRDIRLQHGIKLQPRQTRWHRLPGYVTLSEVAQRLGTSRNWISGKIRRGAIHTLRGASGQYLFPDTEQAMAGLRQLRAGTARAIDLTQHPLQQEGHHYG
jgi:DNA invertase Pin-like site-specific DNA recombinase